MTARISEGEWTPLRGSLPAHVDSNTVYVVPTRASAQAGDAPHYTENVRYLPKVARSKDAPVEFATPNGTRKYIAEYGIDPEVWSLCLASLQMANDWLIFTVGLFIGQRAEVQGWKPEEAAQLPLKVAIAETSTGRTYVVEGSGTDVLEALRLLQRKQGEEVQEAKEIGGQDG